MIKSTIKTANNVNSILSCNCLNKRPLSASPPRHRQSDHVCRGGNSNR